MLHLVVRGEPHNTGPQGPQPKAGLLRLTFISPLGFISPLRLARALHSSVRVSRRDELLRPYQRGRLRGTSRPSLDAWLIRPMSGSTIQKPRKSSSYAPSRFPPTTGLPTRGRTVNGASHRAGYGWESSWRLTHPPSNVPGGFLSSPGTMRAGLLGRLGSSIPPCTLHVLFTLFPECFAEVPHGTFALSVIPLVFSLGRIAPPVFSL